MVKEFEYKQRPKTPEYERGMERIFGKRCIKHPMEKLPCKRCKRGKDDSI